MFRWTLMAAMVAVPLALSGSAFADPPAAAMGKVTAKKRTGPACQERVTKGCPAGKARQCTGVRAKGIAAKNTGALKACMGTLKSCLAPLKGKTDAAAKQATTACRAAAGACMKPHLDLNANRCYAQTCAPCS